MLIIESSKFIIKVIFVFRGQQLKLVGHFNEIAKEFTMCSYEFMNDLFKLLDNTKNLRGFEGSQMVMIPRKENNCYFIKLHRNPTPEMYIIKRPHEI